jgi:hypothetical protein
MEMPWSFRIYALIVEDSALNPFVMPSRVCGRAIVVTGLRSSARVDFQTTYFYIYFAVFTSD